MKIGKSGHYSALRRNVGNSHRDVDLRQGMGYLAAARSRCQNGTPRVRHDIAFLCCGVATVHSEQFLDFIYEHLVFVHRLFRDPNKGLMGVHIRVYERENVSYLAEASPRRYSFSIINYSTTKSG